MVGKMIGWVILPMGNEPVKNEKPIIKIKRNRDTLSIKNNLIFLFFSGNIYLKMIKPIINKTKKRNSTLVVHLPICSIDLKSCWVRLLFDNQKLDLVTL